MPPKLINDDGLLEAIQNDEDDHDNQLKKISIRAEVGYWLFQGVMLSNIVLASLSSSNYFDEDMNKSLNLASGCLSTLTIFLGHLNKSNYSKKGVMSAISKSYPVLKQNLTKAMDENGSRDVESIFNQIDNNARIIKDTIGKAPQKAVERRPLLGQS